MLTMKRKHNEVSANSKEVESSGGDQRDSYPGVIDSKDEIQKRV